MAKISVLIPCFNVEKYISQCIESVLNQDFQDIEIICVDDGSTDHTLRLLKEYERQDTRLKVLSQTNKGQSAARNVALNVATSKYTFFLDSDDWLEKEALKALYEQAERTSSDIVICNQKLYYEGTGKRGYYRDEILFHKMSESVMTLKDEPRLASIIGVWDRLYLSSILKNTRFIEGLIYEDFPFTLECLVNAKKITLNAEHFYNYRKNRPDSITTQETSKKALIHRRDFLKAHKLSIDLLIGSKHYDACFNFLLLSLSQAQMHLRSCSSFAEEKKFKLELQKIYNPAKAIGFPEKLIFFPNWEFQHNRFQEQISLFTKILN